MKSDVIIIEGKIQYIPRIVNYDKFGRHAITVSPTDQSIIDDLKAKRSDMLESMRIQNNVPADVEALSPTWKQMKDSDLYVLSFTYNDQQIDQQQVVLFDENGAQYTYDGEWPLDRQLRQADVKLSFRLGGYCFKNANDETILGVKLLLRKLQVLKYADLTDIDAAQVEESRELVGVDF